MRPMFVRSLALALCLAPVSLLAQGKIGIINTQKALLDTAEMKKAQAAMEAKFKPRTSEMEKLQKESETINTQLETMRDKLKPEVQADLSSKLARNQRDLQRMQEDLQADVDRDRNDILGAASAKMQVVVKKLAEEKGLDVLVDQSNTVYFKEALDITAEVTAAYDKAHPAQ